jgi:hypothetical protein
MQAQAGTSATRMNAVKWVQHARALNNRNAWSRIIHDDGAGRLHEDLYLGAPAPVLDRVLHQVAHRALDGERVRMQEYRLWCLNGYRATTHDRKGRQVCRHALADLPQVHLLARHGRVLQSL